jgi:dihydrofolate synthase/folylpolyglutamate synthase
MNEAITYLMSLPRFDRQGAVALKPGLERIEALLERMGNPHRTYASVHVGGTNGKGSTASLIASIASAAGRRVGLHTSPHLAHVAELMRVDGAPADETWIARAVMQHEPALREVGPSFFEATVALSLAYFAERNVELAVVEVGLGGRLDATNVLVPDVSVITNVGLEHQQILGDTLEDIAREKAGIIKTGVPVVTAVGDALRELFRMVAQRRGAPFHHIADEMILQQEYVALRGSFFSLGSPIRTYDGLFLELAGRHQIRNAVTAVRAAELVLEELRAGARPAFDGLREVRTRSGLRGRFDVLQEDPLVVVDVAHNPDGLAVVLEHLRSCGGLGGRLTVLLGVMRDKDVSGMGGLLSALGATVHPVSIRGERALTPGELAAALQVVGVSVAEPCEVHEGLQAFLSDASRPDTLLITGSHLVLAQLEGAVF